MKLWPSSTSCPRPVAKAPGLATVVMLSLHIVGRWFLSFTCSTRLHSQKASGHVMLGCWVMEGEGWLKASDASSELASQGEERDGSISNPPSQEPSAT